MSGPILQANGLAKRYDNGAGVGPLDLTLEPGTHGILGPNGSGKTTLLKTILGFHPATAGTATVFGADIATPIAVRRLVGYMPENDALIPGLNAVQTVRLAAALSGLSATQAIEAAAEALHAVGLREAAAQTPNQLSTGQRQRMKLASALVHGPKLLVLDEPTNGLDAPGRRNMLRLIREIAKERAVSVLLSTHILPDVEAVCDSAIVLRDGRLAGIERVTGREAVKVGAKSWYVVEAFGPRDVIEEALAARKLKTQEQSGRLQVAATGPDEILSALNGVAIVSRVVGATAGIEDAVLAQMEDP